MRATMLGLFPSCVRSLEQQYWCIGFLFSCLSVLLPVSCSYCLLNCLRTNGSRGILTIFLWSFCMPDTASDRQPKLHWKFELTRLHYLTYLRYFMAGGSLLNFLVEFASISRVSLTGAGGSDPWTPWPAPRLVRGRTTTICIASFIKK